MFKRIKVHLVLLPFIVVTFMSATFGTQLAHAASRPHVPYFSNCVSTHLKLLNSNSADQPAGGGGVAYEVIVYSYEIVGINNTNCGFWAEFRFYNYSNQGVWYYGDVIVDGNTDNPIYWSQLSGHQNRTSDYWYFGRCIRVDGFMGGGVGGGNIIATANTVCL